MNKRLSAISLLLLPVMAHAADAASPDFMGDIVGLLRSSLSNAGAIKGAGIMLLFGLAAIEMHRQGITWVLSGWEPEKIFGSIVKSPV